MQDKRTWNGGARTGARPRPGDDCRGTVDRAKMAAGASALERSIVGSATVLAAVAQSQCHSTHASICGGTCTSDPAPRCVVEPACTDSTTCPSGTACSVTPGTTTTQCVLPASYFDGTSGILVDGFDAPALTLTTVESAQASFAAFTWVPYNGATQAECALFGCPPVIVETFGEGDVSTGGFIANYDECVIARQLFPGGNGVFDLGNPLIAYTPAPAPNGTGTTCPTSPRLLTSLLVGCWIYGDTSIIQASPLVPLSRSSVANYPDLAVLGEPCSPDDSSCPLSTGVFGTCALGTCAARCLTNADCTGSAAAACDHSTGYTGFCSANAEED